jgi:hypothetical protein
LNLVLTILGYVPGIIHALFVVSAHKGDKRADRLIKAMKHKAS